MAKELQQRQGDPRKAAPQPPQPRQEQQREPGLEAEMTPASQAGSAGSHLVMAE